VLKHKRCGPNSCATAHSVSLISPTPTRLQSSSPDPQQSQSLLLFRPNRPLPSRPLHLRSLLLRHRQYPSATSFDYARPTALRRLRARSSFSAAVSARNFGSPPVLRLLPFVTTLVHASLLRCVSFRRDRFPSPRTLGRYSDLDSA
jgi:hypothetical protein